MFQVIWVAWATGSPLSPTASLPLLNKAGWKWSTVFTSSMWHMSHACNKNLWWGPYTYANSSGHETMIPSAYRAGIRERGSPSLGGYQNRLPELRGHHHGQFLQSRLYSDWVPLICLRESCCQFAHATNTRMFTMVSRFGNQKWHSSCLGKVHSQIG